MPTLLVVDDEPGVLEFVNRAMTRRGWLVEAVSSVHDGLAIARVKPVDVALCDVVMPQAGGHEFTSGMRSISAEIPVVLMSAHPIALERPGGPVWGSHPAVLTKPFRVRDLEVTIEEALPRRSVHRASSPDSGTKI